MEKISFILVFLLLGSCSKIKKGSCLVSYHQEKPYILKVISNERTCVMKCLATVRNKDFDNICTKEELKEIDGSCDDIVAKTEEDYIKSEGWGARQGYKVADCGD